jgi:hypothetical protein
MARDTTCDVCGEVILESEERIRAHVQVGDMPSNPIDICLSCAAVHGTGNKPADIADRLRASLIADLKGGGLLTR